MFDDPVMLFELSNVKQKKHTHCGVLEFTAEEGVCYIPYWMMQNLLLTEGDVVKLQYTKLEKGNFVKSKLGNWLPTPDQGLFQDNWEANLVALLAS